MPDRQLSILTYHAVDERESVISLRPDRFRQQMLALQRSGLRGINLQQAFEHFEQEGCFPASAVVLTFDDGYLSIFDQAAPLLLSLGYSATLFITTGTVGLGAGAAGAVNRDLNRDTMSWAQLAELAGCGFEIGAHTLDHPDLRQLSGSELERQIGGSRARLEDRLGLAVHSFAYPYGYFDDRAKQAASEHFCHACTTRLGHNPPGQDRLALRRLDAYYLDREPVLLRAARGGLGAWWAVRQIARDARARFA